MSGVGANLACKPADYKSDLKPIWCPGCGDYHVLMSFTRAFAQLGLPPENIVVVSGIGCSSRIPAYTNCYGFHGVHGRSRLGLGEQDEHGGATVAAGCGHGVRRLRDRAHANLGGGRNRERGHEADRGFRVERSVGGDEHPLEPRHAPLDHQHGTGRRTHDVVGDTAEKRAADRSEHDFLSANGHASAGRVYCRWALWLGRLTPGRSPFYERGPI